MALFLNLVRKFLNQFPGPGLSMRAEILSICVSAIAAVFVILSTSIQTAMAGFLLSFLIIFVSPPSGAILSGSLIQNGSLQIAE